MDRDRDGEMDLLELDLLSEDLGDLVRLFIDFDLLFTGFFSSPLGGRRFVRSALSASRVRGFGVVESGERSRPVFLVTSMTFLGVGSAKSCMRCVPLGETC